MKTKNELEQAIVMHEEALESSRNSVLVDTQDLEQAKKALASFNKPELTGSQLDDINEAVEKAVGNFDFDDADNYNTEFELDYDAKVTISSFEFQSAQELIEAVVEQVHKLFIEIEDKDND
jgi:cell division GTPase FtsZ